MSNLVNIYNDNESAIIIDETTTNLTQVDKFTTLGRSPFNISAGSSNDAFNLQNLFFLELNIFDVDESFIVTLNSARPLLKQPSTGKYYFEDFHVHQDVYMVGAKHTSQPHETLEVVKSNQIIPYPLEARATQDEIVGDTKRFAIKTNEIFDVLKNLPNYNLTANTKFIITYGVFQDTFLVTRLGIGLVEQ